MNETSDHPDPPAPTEATGGFKGYAEADKALRSLQPPISEEAKADYLKRVRACPSARYVAFRFLALRAVGEMQTKLMPLIESLEKILHTDANALDLRQCESIEAVRNAMSEHLGPLRQKSDWKRFVGERSHLPVLYALIRVWDDPVRFQAGLDALTAATDRLNKPKRSNKGKPSNSLEILARALIARIPEKPLVGTALWEILKVSQALFRQGEETSRDNLELQSKLLKATADIDSLRTNLESETHARENLETQAESLRADVSRLQKELEREKEHFETLKALGEQDRKRAVGDAVARLRSEVSRRVENIRLFADREQPNRQAILNLTAEIGEALASEGGDR